jgi:hypothetical protein
MDDDDFKPCLGRMRAKGGKRAKKYLNQVVGALVRKRAVTGEASRRFDGSRIGRGAGIGRVLRSGDRHAGMRSRRGSSTRPRRTMQTARRSSNAGAATVTSSGSSSQPRMATNMPISSHSRAG